MLRLTELTKDFGGLRAVDHCSFDVPRNTIFGLIGPNGSGKSTIFNLITGFLEPTKGEVRFQDRSITGKPPFEINRQGIARTFQLVRVFRNMTVMENLLLAPESATGRTLSPSVIQATSGAGSGRGEHREGPQATRSDRPSRRGKRACT